MLFEAKIIELLQAGATEFWLTFFRLFTLFGSWLGFVAVLIPFFFKKKSYSYAFFATYGIGVLFNTVLKHIIMRPRPFVLYDTIANFASATGYSMPSGHSNSAAMIAVFVAFYAIKLGKHKSTKICVPIIMTLYVALIALSRMFLGAHYLTDVIVGIIEGVIVATIGLIVYNWLVKRQRTGKADGKTNKTESGNKE